MSATIALDVALKSPIEQVWHALTDPATLSKWMMFETRDFRAVVGHTFQFRMQPDPNWAVIVDCEVLVVDEPHRLSYTWVVESQSHHTTVTWTLTETEDGGTRLHLEQSGFHQEAKQEIGGAKGGWTQMLKQLQELLASETTR